MQIHITFMRISLWRGSALNFLQWCGSGSLPQPGFILCGSGSPSKWVDCAIFANRYAMAPLWDSGFSFWCELHPDPQHCRKDNRSLGVPKHRPADGFRGDHVTYENLASIVYKCIQKYYPVTLTVTKCLEIHEFDVKKSILPGVSCWLAALKACTRHWSCFTAGTSGGISSGLSIPGSMTACWYQDILDKCILRCVPNIFEEQLYFT